MAIQWTEGGEPFASLDDFEGSRDLMREWIKNDLSGIDFAERFNTEASIVKMAEVLELHNMAVSFKTLGWVYTILKDSGQLTAPTPPVVPLTRSGVPMTEAQQRWSEYRTFSESHSMQEIRERKRTDAGFASFVLKNYEREMNETPVPDAVELSSGEMRPTSVRGRL